MSPEDKTDHSTQHLANERTFLAWLRTCIALIGLGFVVARFSLFLREFSIITKGQVPTLHTSIQSSSTILGMSMIALGILLIIYALKNYLKNEKSIEMGKYTTSRSINYTASAGIIIFGVIVLSYLLILSF
jgi:putative membrane protein